jgi:hypothetical protein
MTRPVVLTECAPHDREKARRILDALLDATSWSCDRRSQIECLRFVGSDGERRIVAMHHAVIDPDDEKTRRDGHRRIADALRDAAIVCLKRAILPVDPDEVEDAKARIAAYSVVVSSQIECGSLSPEFILGISSPWRPAHYRIYENQFGLITPGSAIDAPHEEMSPIAYRVSEGDSGEMAETSIGLYTTMRMVPGGATSMDALRAGWTLQHSRGDR